MYKIRIEESFDSAHFLAGYEGKCSNLHGHRWRIVMEAKAETLHEDGQLRGMVTDFGDIRRDLKELADSYDHAFIYESGTLKTVDRSGITGRTLPSDRSTVSSDGREFSKFFYEKMTEKGYDVQEIAVYETPNNCAIYSEN